MGALAHGSFWAIIGATAVAIVPPKHIGVATIVFRCICCKRVWGTVINYIGIALGWHNAFWFMAIFSAIALVGILLLIPRIQSNSAIGIASLKHVFSQQP